MGNRLEAMTIPPKKHRPIPLGIWFLNLITLLSLVIFALVLTGVAAHHYWNFEAIGRWSGLGVESQLVLTRPGLLYISWETPEAVVPELDQTIVDLAPIGDQDLFAHKIKYSWNGIAISVTFWRFGYWELYVLSGSLPLVRFARWSFRALRARPKDQTSGS